MQRGRWCSTANHDRRDAGKDRRPGCCDGLAGVSGSAHRPFPEWGHPVCKDKGQVLCSYAVLPSSRGAVPPHSEQLFLQAPSGAPADTVYKVPPSIRRPPKYFENTTSSIGPLPSPSPPLPPGHHSVYLKEHLADDSRTIVFAAVVNC